MKTFIKDYIKDSIETKEQILQDEKLISTLEEIAKIIINAYSSGKKVITAGNGGSAADAQHIAAELVSKFQFERPALNAIALTTNSSILTSVGNDYNHDFIFARQIQAYAQEGDVFIAISTSGNSENIIKAINEAKARGVIVIGLCGNKNSKMDNLCDVLIKIPALKTPVIQESQIMIGHIICALVEKELFKF